VRKRKSDALKEERTTPLPSAKSQRGVTSQGRLPSSPCWMGKGWLFLSVFLLHSTAASAQVNRPEHLRAIAAGYKAAFLCSNLFNGGLTEAQTEADDLRGTYPELAPILPTLHATIDREHHAVSVPFAENLPPRMAVWRPHLGCAQLPVGATANAVALPTIAEPRPDRAQIDARPWPMGDRAATARQRGDAAALARAVANAFDRRSYGPGTETTAVLVVLDGRIVAERYRADLNMHSSQRTWSAAKSIAATLVGVAVQDGILRVDTPLAIRNSREANSQRGAAIPEWTWNNPRGQITVDQLLRMSSGLNNDQQGNRTDDLYFGGVAFRDQIGSLPLVAKPGTTFRYANNDILLAVRATQYALSQAGHSLEYPVDHLFRRIGMTRTEAETDWQGTLILSSQVWTTARDLARLGLLYLNDGMWNGERILPPGWRDYVRRNGPAQPASGYGYGAGWWTFPARSGLPPDAIVARGNRGQYMVVLPSRRLVIVRRGFDRTGDSFDLDAFTRDVLASLR